MKQYGQRRGVTLLELIIAIILLAIIVLGLSGIELFSRFQTIDIDRRAFLQNEVSFILELMARDIAMAIGDNAGVLPPVLWTSGPGNNIRMDIRRDDNPQNGQADASDNMAAYWFRNDVAKPNERFQMWYCRQCTSKPCANCNPVWGSNVLSRRISDLRLNYPVGANWVEANLTACWDPDGQPNACGTPMNPEVFMTTRANMLSASAQ